MKTRIIIISEVILRTHYIVTKENVYTVDTYIFIILLHIMFSQKSLIICFSINLIFHTSDSKIVFLSLELTLSVRFLHDGVS